MRLESLNCPNCHAPLDYSPGQTLCICLYCHSTIRIHHDTPQPEATADTTVSASDMAEIKELLLAGQMATAVQRYQQIAHCSQSEAQTAVTNLSNQISFTTLRQQQLSPFSDHRDGTAGDGQPLPNGNAATGTRPECGQAAPGRPFWRQVSAW